MIFVSFITAGIYADLSLCEKLLREAGRPETTQENRAHPFLSSGTPELVQEHRYTTISTGTPELVRYRNIGTPLLVRTPELVQEHHHSYWHTRTVTGT
jgi:hypothetical protein